MLTVSLGDRIGAARTFVALVPSARALAQNALHGREISEKRSTGTAEPSPKGRTQVPHIGQKAKRKRQSRAAGLRASTIESHRAAAPSRYRTR
jgi:hypothetical protein